MQYKYTSNTGVFILYHFAPHELQCGDYSHLAFFGASGQFRAGFGFLTSRFSFRRGAGGLVCGC